MRILVTNDDGIDAIGLHVLARSIAQLGDVIVVAPDREYSGAGAALGALWEASPEVHKAQIDGLEEVWSVSGPPAQCTLYARLGAFGTPPDFIVSGINPGNNVGRSIYHSGTIGAVVTGRNSGISGIAVSQAVDGWDVEGQGWEATLPGQRWDAAAAVAQTAAAALLEDLPEDPVVLNLNVPNRAIGDILGWRYADVGHLPMRAITTVDLEPKPGHTGSYRVNMGWGDRIAAEESVDAGAVNAGYVAATFLSPMVADKVDAPTMESALDTMLGATGR